jgi:tetratricopeptide (TPR) repeat protein
MASNRADLEAAADRAAHARALINRLGPGVAADVHLDLAQAFTSAGRLDDASAELDAARARDRESGDAGVAADFRRARIANTAAVIAERRVDPATALEHHRAALAALERAGGPHHPSVADAHEGMWRASRLLSPEVNDEARAWLRRAAEIRETLAGPENEFFVHYMAGVADGELADRRGSLERAVAVAEKLYGAHHGNVANALAQLALVRTEAGDHAAALELARRADAIAVALHGADSTERSVTLAAIIEAHSGAGDGAAAVASSRELLRLFPEPGDGGRIAALALLAHTLTEQGAWREARDAAREALEHWSDAVFGELSRVGLEMAIDRASHELGDGDGGEIARIRARQENARGHDELEDADREALAEWDSWLAEVSPADR